MGNVSSCCSAEPAKNTETIKLACPSNPNQYSVQNASEKVPGHSPQATSKGYSKFHQSNIVKVDESTLAQFQAKLEDSISVTVLLADGTNLPCQLKLKPEMKSLVISCESNFRDVPLGDLKAILHGKDQLKRVETKASLTKDQKCVALHMVTGNCIPIRFNEEEEKNCFIQLITKLKASL